MKRNYILRLHEWIIKRIFDIVNLISFFLFLKKILIENKIGIIPERVQKVFFKRIKYVNMRDTKTLFHRIEY